MEGYVGVACNNVLTLGVICKLRDTHLTQFAIGDTYDLLGTYSKNSNTIIKRSTTHRINRAWTHAYNKGHTAHNGGHTRLTGEGHTVNNLIQ